MTLVIHAFLDQDADGAREVAREPLCAYLRSSFGLIAGSLLGDRGVDPSSIDDKDIDFLVSRSFDRYFETAGLFGTLDTAAATIERLAAIGADEVACLVDFGGEPRQAPAALGNLAEPNEAGAGALA